MNTFSIKFVGANSVKYFTWWTENKPTSLGKRSPKDSEFDVLCEVVKKANQLTTLNDQKKVKYTIKKSLNSGKFVLLNDVVDVNSELKTGKHFGYLTLPNHSYDVKNFYKTFKGTPVTKPAPNEHLISDIKVNGK